MSILKSLALITSAVLLFSACGDNGPEPIVGQTEEVYTNSDGSLHRSDVHSFKGRKTAPRKCGDLPF